MAGAILLGRTNMPPMADGGSQRGYFGRTESPYNQEYMCTSYASGFSLGSGVATAAGFAPTGLGSETYIGKGTTSAGDAPAFADSIRALWLQAKKDLETLGASTVETNFPLVENYTKQHFPGQAAHVPGMPEGWIDIERCQMIALGWDNFLRTNDAPNCKTLATVDHKKIRSFYAPLDDLRKHTEAQNHVRYADMIAYIRHRPESIHDLPGCAEARRSLEAARKRDLDSWLDEHGCDAIVFPTNEDVPRADAEEVLSSMQHALRDGVKYSNGTRALKHMCVPAITVPMGIMADKQMPVGLTFAGRAYTDVDLLRYAYAFETATRH
ncbi:glutamyl-tRNA(Gln) amidotransferase subunit A [Verticillium alfalfae VaMs.102]|uniref:Glutamyl-tRNA(Gln) amidotransferase subunit A n=1 Tax=Verticillium alfalfae (strain VaMs.102 / ATCC MYA-4576 / FGSC 10136) TaxID=526221 RepID=C9SFK2_VERA1|nr:glutamyl-tRNA(Gln) amidotransferase subunit A [Verticillium alfalfae VaMs.102]EEY17335.1 glutamyl-tRNA(Gln) amidotransferase subunit A [Verticillium alfalfae VaMs.102]